MTEATNPASGDTLSATDVQPGQVYRTLLGERVEIVADDGPFQKPLTVRFPEREPQPGREEHVQKMSRYAFADAANFEGYELISEDGAVEGEPEDDSAGNLPGEWTDKTPRCPRCGAFMSTGFDGMGHPMAGCSRSGCETYMDDRELIDGGYFRED